MPIIDRPQRRNLTAGVAAATILATTWCAVGTAATGASSRAGSSVWTTPRSFCSAVET